MDVDEAWRQGSIVWYRRGGVGQSLEREVRAIDPNLCPDPPSGKERPQPMLATAAESTPEKGPSVWIYLVGGARFK